MNERTKHFFLKNKSLLEKQGLDELYNAAIRSKTLHTSDVTEALMRELIQCYKLIKFMI